MSRERSDEEMRLQRSLGARMRVARSMAGRSTTDLAKALGVERGTLAGWENGSCCVTAVMLVRLCNELKISTDLLLARLE